MKDRLEQRLSPRRSAAIPAQIVFGAGKMDCIIRNVSETGAKIEVRMVNKVPRIFQLAIRGHEPQQCQVVWRSLREMGVSFINGSNLGQN